MSSPNDIIAVCGECKSDQPDAYIEKNPFYQAGKEVPCRYCGGIVIITLRGGRKSSLDRVDTRRAIGHDPDKPQ